MKGSAEVLGHGNMEKGSSHPQEDEAGVVLGEMFI